MDERDDLSDPMGAAMGDAAPQERPAQDVGASATGDTDATAPDGAPPAGGAPLAAGAALGSYTIARVLRSDPNETVYLARREGTTGYFYDAGPIFVSIVERPEGAFRGVEAVAALGLRHPRLLAPRDVFSRTGRAYLVIEGLVSEDGAPLPSVEEGARLTPRAALTGGAGAADALAYLHRSGVAHGHVAPRTLFARDGRLYLGGMEQATFDPHLADEAPEAQDAVARDTNGLAAALGALVDATDDAAAAEDRVLAQAVREIAAHGAAGEFPTPNDLAGACAFALQQTDQIVAELQVEAPPARIELAVGTATSVGRVRAENQDACASVILDVHDDVGDRSPVALLLVADGMGGEARGELASRIAARIVAAEIARQYAVPYVAIPALLVTSDSGQEAIERPAAGGIAQALARAAGLANNQIRELARQLGQTTGTTLTAVAIAGAHAALAHVGDSRAFLLRGGRLHRLTEDHSVLARLQAIDHPLLSDPDVYVPRSMLYRSLGQEDDAQADMIEFPLVVGDRLLLCSDGLWDEVDPALLERTFTSAGEPGECARALVALADEAGGHDNSTAVVAFIRGTPHEGHEGNAADMSAEGAQAAETADA